MKTLFWVDRKYFKRKKANKIALTVLQESEYLYMEIIAMPTLKGILRVGDRHIPEERYRNYWIYEFSDELPVSMPSYKVWRDGNIADGTGRRVHPELTAGLAEWLKKYLNYNLWLNFKTNEKEIIT